MIECRVRAVMKMDKHAGKGGYAIRSVYFDDRYDTAVHENEDGVDPREKFRIRIYDCSDSRIALECKRKEKGKTLKQSCAIDKELCSAILQWGGSSGIILHDCQRQDAIDIAGGTSCPPLLRKFIAQMIERGLRPVCMVCYEREPFVCSAGNVRVTFDRNIRSSRDVTGLFDRNIACRPVLPCGVNMMEVKYDEFIPDYLSQMLETGALAYSSFSKYYLCRKYAVRTF